MSGKNNLLELKNPQVHGSGTQVEHRSETTTHTCPHPQPVSILTHADTSLMDILSNLDTTEDFTNLDFSSYLVLASCSRIK
jgi:hypothetical protein